MSELESSPIPPHTCPVCHNTMDRTTCMNDDPDLQPRDGDFTVCVSCGAIGVFDKDAVIHTASTEEIREMMRDFPDTWKQVERFSRMIRMDGLKGRAI
jgi:hypothetical protein